jgi:hypothetical protein
MRILTTALLLAACGEHGQSPDGGTVIPGETGPIILETHTYVMASQQIPTDNTSARTLSLDINGDGTSDNQLGMVMATLSSQGFDTQANTTKAVQQGQILMLVEIGANGFGGGPGTFTTRLGTDPVPAPCAGAADTVCGQHLQGTGTFQIAADAERTDPLIGSFASDTLLTSFPAGTLQIQTTFFTPDPITMDLGGAQIRASGVSEKQVTSGVIAGAITQSDLNTKVLPQMQTSIMASVVRDCTQLTSPPDCGCAQGSPGKTMIGLFDTAPQNCAITVAELQGNSLLQSLLAPDVTVNGQQALSFGFGFTAIAGTFSP